MLIFHTGDTPQSMQITVYSYFEKGCREKCTLQPPKDIVSGLEFTVLQRNLKEFAQEAMGGLFPSAKGKQQKSQVRQLQFQEQYIFNTSHIREIKIHVCSVRQT